MLASRLARRPGRLGRELARVCDWLAAWQRLTRTPTELSRADLDAELLTNAELLAPHLDGGQDYLASIERRCAAALATTVSLSAAHNDLTMWNVLAQRRGSLGIVDWEVAQATALPLKDFPYAVADAVAATGRYADRLGAAMDCFGARGAHASRVQVLQAYLAGAVNAAPATVDLSFHACWLHHAANELRSAGPSDPRPSARSCSGWHKAGGRPQPEPSARLAPMGTRGTCSQCCAIARRPSDAGAAGLAAQSPASAADCVPPSEPRGIVGGPSRGPAI